MTRSTEVFHAEALRSRQGYYTLEAVIFLPLIVLLVLSFGYFTKVEGVWENCIHCAVDESARSQAMAWDGISGYATKSRVTDRIAGEDRGPSSFSVRRFLVDYSDGGIDHLSSFFLDAGVHMSLPAGFSRDFAFSCPIVYRGFVGRNITGDPLGVSGLESGDPGDPVHIFPAFGKKTHSDDCTYVKAVVHSESLTSSLRKTRSSCAICKSGDLPTGSIVFCFSGSDTAYHRGNCRTIDRHVIVMDRGEAQKKGYGPCSKCGGR